MIKTYLYPKPTEFERQMRGLDTQERDARNVVMLEILAEELSKAIGFPRETFDIIAPPELRAEKRIRDRLTEVLGSEELAERYLPTGKFADDPLYQPFSSEANYDNSWRTGIGANPLAPFLWISHKGEAHYVTDMATPHLFYSLRMLWNNTVPPAFRVGKFKRYSDIPNWSKDYVQRAINELSTELAARSDLDTEVSDSSGGTTIADQIGDMQANLTVITALGI